MEIAIMIEGQDGLTWPRWQRLASAVEQLGFVGLYRSDHFTNAGQSQWMGPTKGNDQGLRKRIALHRLERGAFQPDHVHTQLPEITRTRVIDDLTPDVCSQRNAQPMTIPCSGDQMIGRRTAKRHDLRPAHQSIRTELVCQLPDLVSTSQWMDQVVTLDPNLQVMTAKELEIPGLERRREHKEDAT